MSLFSNYVPFKIELEKYIDHCKNVFDQIGDHESASLVNGFIHDLHNQRYNITIVGSFNRGKSTLLNTLMERHNDDISPIASSACTSAIIKYIDQGIANSSDKKEKAVVYFNNPEMPAATIPFAQLRNYVTEEKNPENRKQVHSVEVFGNFPAWSKAVSIVDSPGQNSIFAHHDTLLADFLPYTDAIIFLVAADIPLDGGDIALIKELSAEEKKKIFFVLTKIDTYNNPDDLDVVKEFVIEKIQNVGLVCEKLYAVSAQPVYDALKHGIGGEELEALKAEHGILELEDDLEKFIIAESDQTKVMRSRIEMLLNKTAEACKQYIASSNDILSQKSYDLAQLKAERQELMNANDILKENAKKSLRKFERAWSKTTSSFKRRFANCSGNVEDKIIDGLNRGGLIGAAFQSFKLQQLITKAVCLELQPLALELEEKLEEIATTLNSEFDEEITLYWKRKRGSDKGAVAGSVVAATTMTGTIVGGGIFTCDVLAKAMAAFGTWQTAASSATMATAMNSWSAGVFPKLGGLLFGSDAGMKAVIAGANAKTALSSAILMGFGTIAAAGVSIAISLIVQKILHIGLVKWQEDRTTSITESVMNDMEESILKSLDAYKDGIIKEYQQKIDDMFEDNVSRLEKIEKIFSEDNSDERRLITEQVQEVQRLLSEGIHVQKQIPMLQ